MPRRMQLIQGILIAGLLVAGPMSYAAYVRANHRNFRTVEESKLYRSGQLSIPGLERAIHDQGIRTVVTLRDAHIPGEPPPDTKEENFCAKEEIYYVRLPPLRFLLKDGEAPADVNVRKFLEVMDDSKYYPVLIHCFAGSHRTGAFCAIYRMEYQGWSNQEAIAELKANGYGTLEEEADILEYLTTYVPRKNKVLSNAQITSGSMLFAPSRTR